MSPSTAEDPRGLLPAAGPKASPSGHHFDAHRRRPPVFQIFSVIILSRFGQSFLNPGLTSVVDRSMCLWRRPDHAPVNYRRVAAADPGVP